MKAIEPPESD